MFNPLYKLTRNSDLVDNLLEDNTSSIVSYGHISS